MPAPGQTIKPLVRLGRKPDGCWQWIGPIGPNGYGKKTFNGRDMLAHRWIWEQLFGQIPAGLVIDHKCGTRDCVNPAHLRAVTQAENCRSGAGATLMPDDVTEIRQARKDGGPGVRKHLAERFGCSPQLISDIWSGRAWRRRSQPFNGPKQPRNQFSPPSGADSTSI